MHPRNKNAAGYDFAALTATSAALAKYLPDCTPVPVSGGGSLWVRIPDGIRAQELADRAALKGVLIEPGDVFFIAQTPPANYIRLGYQSIAAHAIEEGIAILASVLRSMPQGQ